MPEPKGYEPLQAAIAELAEYLRRMPPAPSPAQRHADRFIALVDALDAPARETEPETAPETEPEAQLRPEPELRPAEASP